MDSKRRSLVKSLTWRLAGIFILGGISYAATGDMFKTTTITVAFHSVRFVLYYYHERLWERIAWGRIRHPLASFVVRSDLRPEDHAVISQFLDERSFTVGKPEYEI